MAKDLDDLATKLATARAGQARDGVYNSTRADQPTGQIAFLFPGQGSQRPGMLADLFIAFPRLRHFLELGDRWASAIFPPAAFTKEKTAQQRAALTDTRIAQPALGITGLAIHQLLTSLGVQPDHLAGHSYGELVALTAAGALNPADLLELSEARGAAILEAAGPDPGTMAAITATPDEIRSVLGTEPVVVANHNAPAQTVISGPTPAVETALNQLTERGLIGTRIPVACAFHSPVITAATRTFATELDRRAINSPTLPVWSNTTAAPYPAEPTAIRATLATHLTQPVRFVEQIEAMYAAGTRIFVESGPGQVLTHLINTILTNRPHTAVAIDITGEPGLHQLLKALAQLAIAGAPIDTTELFHNRNARLIPATATAHRPSWRVNGHLVKTTDGHHLTNGLRPAQPVTVPIAEPDSRAASADPREATVLEFLRSTRELVAAQREIILGYLDTPAPAPATVLPSIAAQLIPAQDTAIDQKVGFALPEPPNRLA